MADQPKSLVSQKSSDSGLRIQLHPLILLSISDHITRHAARQQQGPITGALLGQHNGREITLEHVFECIAVPGPNDEAQLPHDWFVERVKQCKQHLRYHEGLLHVKLVANIDLLQSKMYTKIVVLISWDGGLPHHHQAPIPLTFRFIARSSKTTPNPQCILPSTLRRFMQHHRIAPSFR